MEYALSRYGILSQRVYTLTLVTPRLPYTYKTEKATYEYHQISKKLFWGYRKEGVINIAQPEKALLDLLYIRCVKNREMDFIAVKSLLDDMDVSDLDNEKLHLYSEIFPPKTREFLTKLGLRYGEKKSI